MCRLGGVTPRGGWVGGQGHPLPRWGGPKGGATPPPALLPNSRTNLGRCSNSNSRWWNNTPPSRTNMIRHILHLLTGFSKMDVEEKFNKQPAILSKMGSNPACHRPVCVLGVINRRPVSYLPTRPGPMLEPRRPINPTPPPGWEELTLFPFLLVWLKRAKTKATQKGDSQFIKNNSITVW